MPSSFFRLSFFPACFFFLFVCFFGGREGGCWLKGFFDGLFGDGEWGVFILGLNLPWLCHEKLLCGKQMKTSVIPEVFLKRPDKFDKKNLVCKKKILLFIKTKKSLVLLWKKISTIISEQTFWCGQTSTLAWTLCYWYPPSALFFGQTISSVSCCSLVPSEVNCPCPLPDHPPSVSPLFLQKWTPKTVQTKLKDLIFITCQPKLVLLIREIHLFAGKEKGSSCASSGYRTQPGLEIAALNLRVHQWASSSVK